MRPFVILPGGVADSTQMNGDARLTDWLAGALADLDGGGVIVSRGGTHLATVFPRLEKTVVEDVDGDGTVTQIEADDPEVYFSVGGRPLTPFRRFALAERVAREAASDARDKAEWRQRARSRRRGARRRSSARRTRRSASSRS